MASEETDGQELIGRTLGGAFRIDQRLGAGGMGAVYSATHQRTGRRYAVKVLLPHVAARRDAVARFKREADAVGALGHANIVAIHDFDEDGGLAYLVMDLLEGEDLMARLDQRGPLPLDEALAIFRQMANGLGAAHARGLVHRDLKPANVFLARQPGAPERAVLLDFGLARSFAEDGELAKLTASGVVLGTPQYMSPEQAGGERLDARADLYSLATILYEMLAGSPPFSAPTLPALFAKLVTDPPPLLSTSRADVPAALSDVLSRALAKHPDERFPDVESLAAAVESAARGMPATYSSVPHARVPHTSSHRAVIAPARSRAPLWLFGIAAVFIVFASVVGAIGALAIFAPRTETPVAAVPPIQIEEAVVDHPAVPPPEPMAPVEVAAPPVVEAPPRERTARVLTPHRAPPIEAPAQQAPAQQAPAQQALPPQAPPLAGPPAFGPPAGVQETTDRMAVRDWRGCIETARRSPRSPQILSARMSCALQANDNDELRATCAELRQHYPEHAYTRTCETLMATR
jgi:hypothetical protein